jgi:hypothetical protein
MSNIFPFPASGTENSRRQFDLKPPAWRMKIRKLSEERQRHRQSGEGIGPLLRQSDRIKCAIALRRQLDTAKQTHGITQANIKDRLSLEAEIISKTKGVRRGTDRVERFLVPRTLELAKVNVNATAKNLPQYLYGYWDVASTIAILCDEDLETAQYELLKDTSIWAKGDQKLIDDDGVDLAAEAICQEIRAACRLVAEKERLNSLLARIARTPGQWNPDTQIFAPSPQSSARGPMLGWNDHWSEAPAYPSLVLGRRAVDQIRVEYATFDKSFEELTDIKAEGEATLFVQQEFRIVLGYATDTNAITPMIERRCFVSLRFDNPEGSLDAASNFPALNQGQASDAVSDLTPESFIAIEFDVGGQGITLELKTTSGDNTTERSQFVIEDWLCDPTDARSSYMPAWYFTYFALTPTSLRFCGGAQSWQDKLSFAEFETPIGEKSFNGTLWTTRNDPLHDLEWSLATGGLVEKFAEQISRIRSAFELHEAAWLEAATSKTDRLIEEWSSDLR